MDNSQLLNILTRILQQNSSKFNSNELFGLVSLILLLEIIDIFRINNRESSSLDVTEKKEKKSNLPSLNNIGGLLSQLQGQNNSNLQQMLPLLMNALSGNKSNLDLGNLMGLLKSVRPAQNEEEKEELIEPEDEEAVNGEEDKKKA